MKIAAAIAAAAAELQTVEAGGLHWQIRQVSTEALLRHGAAVLPVLPLPADGSPAPAPTPDGPAQVQAIMRAWLCAAVAGVSDDGGATWEPIAIVATPAEANPEAGRVCLEDLPTATRTTLVSQARGSEALADAVARFRRSA